MTIKREGFLKKALAKSLSARYDVSFLVPSLDQEGGVILLSSAEYPLGFLGVRCAPHGCRHYIIRKREGPNELQSPGSYDYEGQFPNCILRSFHPKRSPDVYRTSFFFFREWALPKYRVSPWFLSASSFIQFGGGNFGPQRVQQLHFIIPEHLFPNRSSPRLATFFCSS